MRAELLTLTTALGICPDLIVARGLRECEEARDLELAETDEHGREHFLIRPAAQAWWNLKAAALADDVNLYIVSGFRSIDRQAELIRRKLAVGQSIEHILEVCAPPGFSEHHTGRAVDVSTNGGPHLESAFDQTPAFLWLSKYAENYGFYLSFPAGNTNGYCYEPWHWCFEADVRADQVLSQS